MITPHGPIEAGEIADGAITTAKQSAAAKIKRMVSNKLNTNTGDDVVVLGYLSTASTITSVKLYTVAAIVGANFVLDVGIEGTDDAIVADEAIGATAIDTVVDVAIDTPDVAAGHLINASVSTADGTSGSVVIAVEYYENE